MLTREWIANGVHRVTQIIECLVEGPLTGTEQACEPFWVRKRLVFLELDVIDEAFTPIYPCNGDWILWMGLSYAHLTD